MALDLAWVDQQPAMTWPEHSAISPRVRAEIEQDWQAAQAPAERQRDELDQLRSTIARQDQRLARLERGITMLRVELYGGTVKQLRAAGITVKATNDPANGKIQPLHEKMIDGLATALAEVVKREREATVKRIEAVEAKRMRFAGVYTQGTPYEPGMVVTRSGSSWHCNVATTAVPGQSPDWEMMTKAGRDGRDLVRKEPTLR